MKPVSGKIIILIDNHPKGANRIQYGFVKVKGMEDVFFNILTSFEGTTFESLKIGDRVRVLVKQTKHGPYAKSLTLSPYHHHHIKSKFSPPPSASL